MIRNYLNFINAFRAGYKSTLFSSRLRLFEVEDCTWKKCCAQYISNKNDSTTPIKKIRSTSDQFDTPMSNSDPLWGKNLEQKFSPYRDEDSNVILDQLEEAELEDTVTEELITPSNDPFYGLNLERGLEGVFDIHTLVDVLKGEKARNICVVRIPREMKYADYMVIVTGFSSRHLLAMAAFIKKLHKKKRATSDPFVIVEGVQSKNWLVMDMGNIVLHLFSLSERTKYDLETLWSIGAEFDDLSQNKHDELMDKFEEHLSFLKSSKPSENRPS